MADLRVSCRAHWRAARHVSLRPRRLRSHSAAVLAAATVLGASGILAGCATGPAGDRLQSVTTGGHLQEYVLPLPPPPPKAGPSNNPSQVVLGFLAASASYAFDPSAARQFLAPELRRKWSPGPVTVISSLAGAKPLLRPAPLQQLNAAAGPNSVETVQFSAEQLATLSQRGQYLYAPGQSTYKFYVTRINGVWLITGLPQKGRILLLTKSDFEEVYQPRNLFFFARPNSWAVNGELVPDPVYAPQQSADSSLNTTLAAGLVRGLLTDQGSWLSGATTTAFPAKTTLLGITFSGQTAVVNLGGAAAQATQQAKQQMAQQIMATLGSRAYSQPLARNVQLEINGRPQFPPGGANLVYEVDPTPLLDLAGPDQIALTGSSSIGPAQLGSSAPVTALAGRAPTSGKPTLVAAAVRSGSGCAVLLPQGSGYRTYPLAASGGPCTSLSWDANGNVWAVAGAHIWVLQTSTNRVLSVSSPANLHLGGKSGASLLALRMAPDGVRAALLVKTRSGNRIVLAAATSHPGRVTLGAAVAVENGLASPVALSWYSPYDLLVLAGGQVWEVPLTGGSGQSLGSTPPDAESLTTNGKTVAVGTSGGEYYTSRVQQVLSWSQPLFGTIPTYSS